jgi:hypothetical protein
LTGVYRVGLNPDQTLDLAVESFDFTSSGIHTPVNLAGSPIVLADWDHANNTHNISTLKDIEVDTVDPSAPSIVSIVVGLNDDPVPVNGYTNDNKPSFTISAEAGTTVKVFNLVGENRVYVGMATESGTPGIYTYTPVSGLNDGEYRNGQVW